MKFKVGDKVKVVRITHYNSDRGKYIGKTFVVKTVNPNGSLMGEHYGSGGIFEYVFYADELELAEFTKADLKDGMVVEYCNGDRRMVLNNAFINDLNYTNIDAYTDTLELDDRTVDKVYKSDALCLRHYFEERHLTLIWERPKEEPIKEMTVAEIEKELGYKVKIKAEN